MDVRIICECFLLVLGKKFGGGNGMSIVGLGWE